MQKKSQGNGSPINIRVIAGPIFDIDLTGIIPCSNFDYYDDDGDMDNYGANK